MAGMLEESLVVRVASSDGSVAPLRADTSRGRTEKSTTVRSRLRLSERHRPGAIRRRLAQGAQARRTLQSAVCAPAPVDQERRQRRTESTWAAVVDSVAAVSRPTDVLGWLEQGSVIGLILPHGDAVDAAVTRELEAKVRLALSARMDVATIARCSIRLLVHCGAGPACTQADFGADPFERIVCRHKVRRHCPGGHQEGVGHHRQPGAAGAAVPRVSNRCCAGEADVFGSRHLPAGAGRPIGQAIHDAEVSNDADARGRRDSSTVCDPIHQRRVTNFRVLRRGIQDRE